MPRRQLTASLGIIWGAGYGVARRFACMSVTCLPSRVMRKLLVLLIVTGVALVAFLGVDGVRDATDRVVRAGQGAIAVGQGAIEAGQSAIEAGTSAAGQARDTVDAARQLDTACDLVRMATNPQTTPEQSASLLQEALGIVTGVVTDYPDVPGVSQLQGAVGTAREVLEADPSGEVLRGNTQAVESACSQLPPIP